MVRYPFLYFISKGLFIAGCLVIIPPTSAEPRANSNIATKIPLAQILPGGYPASFSATNHDNNMQTNPLIEQAIRDLAQRESTSPSAIEVVSYEEVTWPDTSLGCPHLDMRYKQVPQDGARIILRIDARTYVYHSGGRQQLFLCTHPAQTNSPPPYSDTDE